MIDIAMSLFRMSVGVIFGLLGLAMSTVTLVIGVRFVAALIVGRPAAETWSLFGFSLIVAIPAALWIALALRVSGAWDRPPSVYGWIVAVLAFLVGIIVVVGNLVPDFGNVFMLGLGVFIFACAVLYLFVRRRGKPLEAQGFVSH